MKSKIEDEAEACARQQAGVHTTSKWFAKGFLRGANFVMKEAERLATRPLPSSLTQFDPYVDLHRLKALFEKDRIKNEE